MHIASMGTWLILEESPFWVNSWSIMLQIWYIALFLHGSRYSVLVCCMQGLMMTFWNAYGHKVVSVRHSMSQIAKKLQIVLDGWDGNDYGHYKIVHLDFERNLKTLKWNLWRVTNLQPDLVWSLFRSWSLFKSVSLRGQPMFMEQVCLEITIHCRSGWWWLAAVCCFTSLIVDSSML